MFKIFKERKKQITFEEFMDKYSKDYFIIVDFHFDGRISVFVGSEKKKNTEQQ